MRRTAPCSGVLRRSARSARGAALLSSLLAACSTSNNGALDGGVLPDGAGTPDGALPPNGVVRRAPGTPADAADHFTQGPVDDASRAATVAYPLDGVVFPHNVFPPDVQWDDAGAAGDLYRVRVSGASPLLTGYVLHTGADFRHDWQPDVDAWRVVADAAGVRELTLTVDRWDRARDQVVRGPAVRLRFARGSIAGAVYYWTLGHFGDTQGRIVRVFEGTEVTPRPENFMPSPPPRADGGRCAACHVLSRDGNRLAVSLGDGQLGAVFDVTTDLSAADPPTVFRLPRPWFYAAFNRDGTRLVMTDPDRGAHLLDARDGRVLREDLTDATHPAWSPDGALLAYVSSADDAWDLHRGDLSLSDMSADDRFGAPRVLHRGADLSSAPEGGVMDAYPTFSPDGRRIAFQHGNRTFVNTADAAGALYLVAPGGGPPSRLTRASGSEHGDAYYPSFTPFTTPGADAGDVWWLLFYSRRDYGNDRAGTRGTRRRQIWVAAVSTDAGASDPSYVPWWLPGQDVAQENASAFWAPRPCRPNAAACSGDDQCCSGSCTDELSPGQRVCRPPPATGCRRHGESCAADGDCCDHSDQCAGHVCLPTPP